MNFSAILWSKSISYLRKKAAIIIRKVYNSVQKELLEGHNFLFVDQTICFLPSPIIWTVHPQFSRYL